MTSTTPHSTGGATGAWAPGLSHLEIPDFNSYSSKIKHSISMFRRLFGLQLTISNPGYRELLYNKSMMHHAPYVSFRGFVRLLDG